MASSNDELRQFTDALGEATRALRDQSRASAEKERADKRSAVSASGLGLAALGLGGAALGALAPGFGAAARGAESPLGVVAGGLTSTLAKGDLTGTLAGFTNARDATEKRIADITSDLAAAGASPAAIEDARRSLLQVFGPQERRRAEERRAVADFSGTEEFRQVFDRGQGAAGAQVERTLENLLRDGVQSLREILDFIRNW